MAYSIKIVLRKEKISRQTGKAPLCIRVTKDREITYKTITHILPKHWDADEQRVKKAHTGAREINALIQKTKDEIERELLMTDITSDTVGVNAIRNKLRNNTSLDVFKYADGHIAQLLKEEKAGTANRDRSVFQKLRVYIGSNTLPVGNLTSKVLEEYRFYLEHTLGNTENTIATNLKVIRAVINKIYDEYNLDQSKNPFRNLKITTRLSERVYLTQNEVKRIIEFELSPKHPLNKVRDIFLFECFTGLRISDILTLKWKNCIPTEGRRRLSSRIRTVMKKTRQKIEIPTSDVVKTILKQRLAELGTKIDEVDIEQRIFAWLGNDFDKFTPELKHRKINSTTANINKQIKNLIARVGINKEVSTHVARHTFATLAISAGVDIYTVSELLGHSSIKTTQIYAKNTAAKKRRAVYAIDDLFDE